MGVPDLKDRLKKTVFDYLDECLPTEIKKKLTASDVSQVIDVVIDFVDDHKDAIALLREPTVLHRSASSFEDRQDQDPDFLSDLSKV